MGPIYDAIDEMRSVSFTGNLTRPGGSMSPESGISVSRIGTMFINEWLWDKEADTDISLMSNTVVFLIARDVRI